MATTTRLFQSTDAGAPVLNGTLDSLINLLKICLVGTAGVAYGSGPTAKPSAGWTLAYQDVPNHKAAFRNDPLKGTGCYCYVLDDGSGTGGSAAIAHIQTYLTMSSISSGTEPTPAAVTGYPGVRVEKSTAANSNPIGWILFADEITWYLAISPDNRIANAFFVGAGDYISYLPGFGYPCFALGGNQAGASSDRGCGITNAVPPTTLTVGSGALMLMRDYTSVSGSVRRAVHAAGAITGVGLGTSSQSAISALFGNAIISSELHIPSAGGLMGRLRGVYGPVVNTNGLTHPITTAGPDAGSSMIVVSANYATTGNSATQFNGSLAVEAALSWQ